MLKQLSIFRKRKDLSRDAFRHYWRDRHPDVVMRLPGIRRYVQNHVTETLRGAWAWDGIAEVWFDDIESMRANAASPVLADIRADEVNFIAPGSMVSIITAEHVLAGDSAATARHKVLALVKRGASHTPEQFQREWRDGIGPQVADLPGVCRYVQDHCRLGIYRTGREPQYDGMASLWYREPFSLAREGRRTVALEGPLTDLYRTVVLAVEEVVIA
ncbi:MAG: EthD family reductase [Gammaproteobacteria bacterium]|nr:EthD family reductase [Gammaproteobacteria bacterium]